MGNSNEIISQILTSETIVAAPPASQNLQPPPIEPTQVRTRGVGAVFLYLGNILSGKDHFSSVMAVFILAAIMTIHPSIDFILKFLPVIQSAKNNIFQVIDETIPEDVTIHIKNGRASTNTTEPFYLSVDRETIEKILSGASVTFKGISRLRVLTIDTNGNVEDFERYQTLALLTENSFAYYSDGKINVQSLRNIRDLTINKQVITDYVNKVNKDNRLTNVAIAIAYSSPLWLLLLYFVLLSVLISFVALFVIVYTKILDDQVPFRRAFAFATIVSGPPLIVWQIADLAIRTSPALVLILILSIAYTGIWRLSQPTIIKNI